MKIIKPFSNLIMFGVFLLGLLALWTDLSPSEIYQTAKNMLVTTNLLTFDQKVSVSHVIRRAEETFGEIFEQIEESKTEEDISEFDLEEDEISESPQEEEGDAMAEIITRF